MESLEEKCKRYEHALISIVCMMEPLGWSHAETCDHCEGCQFEMDESLTVAMNVLAGLAENAHWGAVHTKEEYEAHQRDEANCVVCAGSSSREDREKAYLARGFVKDADKDGRTLWRRGTAF